jgi:hypothetical protein
MSEPLTKDELIDTLEAVLEGQLRAMRSLRGGKRRKAREDGTNKRKSNITIIEDRLKAAEEPLHVNEIIARAKREHGVELKRESIVSALTKKVLDRRTFCRTGPNEFDLIDRARA